LVTAVIGDLKVVGLTEAAATIIFAEMNALRKQVQCIVTLKVIVHCKTSLNNAFILMTTWGNTSRWTS